MTRLRQKVPSQMLKPLTVLPGMALQRHDPGRTDPRGDNRKHHTSLGRILRGVKLGKPRQLLQLMRIKIRKGKIAKDAFKKAMNHCDHDADGNQREHQPFLQRVRIADPFPFERPEIKNIRHPDKDDQPPAAIIVSHIGRVKAHDAARILKHPPGDGKNKKRHCHVGQHRPRPSPALDELALFKIRNVMVSH